ncbi:polyprenyl synthetase family protein [Periweissella fabalis]|uniref:Polyprenyl synthetase family protein n=1 Tax=Periweissella fabalis TaxID=1070421 RepID=A0A7X6S2T8_9LACO|nr:polyprenyl synthetase family protein [Periweissella fabalis]MCM0599770.1 polyprenyl synthetase family protein [Periweissella fabalis]NKZ24424.1 polyprenyl synthetase family protein [Periweissella fabalis]
MAHTQLHPLWIKYPALKRDLGAVVELIEQNINLDESDVKNAIIKMIENGGKMLRPAYTLLMSSFYEIDHQRILGLAAAIETLHAASLIHDDIIDDAPTRRHLASIQQQFGKDVAVYAGDYLFVVVFRLLSKNHFDLEAIQRDTQYLDNLLAGELNQKDARYNFAMTIDQYLKQIDGKTAELFALATTIGANKENAPTDFLAMADKIGRNIGMAFQILDDILDYEESSKEIGKPTLEDLRQGVYSAPLIFAMTSHSDEILPILKKKTAITDAEALALDRLVKAYGLLPAKELAKEYTRKAITDIQKLPDKPAKKILLQLTTQLLKRKN